MSANLIKTLRRRYGRALGLLKAGKGDARQHMADITHLAAVMQMFGGSDFDIAPIRPTQNRRGGGGRWLKSALEVLREAKGPLSARQLTEALLAARGLPLGGPEAASARRSLLATFRRRTDLVSVEHGARGECRWVLLRSNLHY